VQRQERRNIGLLDTRTSRWTAQYPARSIRDPGKSACEQDEKAARTQRRGQAARLSRGYHPCQARMTAQTGQRSIFNRDGGITPV